MAEKHPGKGRTEKELIPIHTHTLWCVHPSESVGKALSSKAEAEMEENVPRNEKMFHYRGRIGTPCGKGLG